MMILFLLACVSIMLTPSRGFFGGKGVPKSVFSIRTLKMYGPPATTESSSEKKEYSFVNDDLRTYAMKLHTRDQAPKEGKMKAQTPFTQWQPSRLDYLRFLVDSLAVYETLDAIVHEKAILEPFRSTGLERTVALKEDIKWMLKYDSTIGEVPPVGQGGKDYSEFLKNIANESIPKFLCHYYNQYFAHTAGGRMIGKKMSDLLLEGTTLKFYQWEGDVKELLDATKSKIDVIANSWDADEKQACLEETMNCFRYGGALMTYMKPPAEVSK